MVVQKGLFVAKDDKGTPYVIDECHELIDTPLASADGRRYLKTLSGQIVTRQEKGKYKIVELGIVLHSDDPNCP